MNVTTRMPIRREMAGQIGAAVLDLIRSRDRDRSDDRVKFTDDDKAWGAAGGFGAYTSMQGLRAVMGGLMAVGADDTLWAAALPHMPSLLDEWRGVLDDPERFSSCKPYAGHDRFAELLDETAGVPRIFTDATSWLLSTALVMRTVMPDLTERGVEVGDVPERAIKAIIESLNLILSAQLPDGGWHLGGVSPQAVGHLFFTWGVLQGFADVSDYVLGESKDEIGVDEDGELLAIMGVELVERFKSARDNASTFLKKTYLDSALAEKLDYKSLAASSGNAPVRVSVDDYGSEIALLYAYSYLQESLILNGVDRDGLPSIGYQADDAKADMDKLQDIVRKRFEQAQVELAAVASDRDIAVNSSTFFVRARAKRQRGPTTPEFVFKDPSLWPQLVRTFVLHPYYVTRSRVPDRYVFDAFRLLMDDRRGSDESPGAGLWDHDAFNLSVSSRAVEALIDVFDYLEFLEAPEEAGSLGPTTVDAPGSDNLAVTLAAALLPHLRPMLQTDASRPAEPEKLDLDGVRGDLQEIADLAIEAPFKSIPMTIERAWKSTTLNFEQIAHEVHGKTNAVVFAQDHDLAYTIFRAMTGVTSYTIAKCLPLLVEQALLYVATDEQRRLLKKKLEKQKSSLQEEILHQLQAMVQQIIDQADDSIVIDDGVSPPLLQTKPKPKGR